MNVRRRLVIGFVGLAAFVLVLFAFVTYRAVLDLDSVENRQRLQTLAKTAADQLSKLPAPLSVESIIQSFPYDSDLETIALIVTEDNKIISRSPVSEFLGGDFKEINIAELTKQPEHYGLYDVGDHAFLWVSSAIKGHGAHFFLLKNEYSKLSEYPRKLGTRLTVTAFIIIWLSIWAALLISTRIVTRLEQQNSELTYQALHDTLTGLPNRIQLFDYLQHLINQNPKEGFSLLVIDIDDFKEINDTLGHEAGDILLVKLGQRLAKTIEEQNMIARLGGDEFAIVLPCNTQANILSCVHNIQRCLQTPTSTHGLDIIVSGSIGCCAYPQDAANAQTLIQRAEIAMYRAKEEHSPYLNYDPEFDPHNVRRLSLMADMRKAIKNNQLTMYYQPKVDIQSGEVRSVEVLTRWCHPEYGLISPDEFINFIERSDFVIEFSLFTIEQALTQCRKWRQAGIEIDVAVNLSANILHDLHLATDIRHILIKNQIDAKHLKIEVTESTIMADPELALKTLRTLSDMNIKLSIDDFGTGHSSLVYLKQLPANELKIDKAFVVDMMTSENDRLIVKTIINLAHNLGYTVVAEGIESADAYDFLKQLGCDTAQGYYISRPLTSEAFDAWIKTSEWPAKSAVSQVFTSSNSL